MPKTCWKVALVAASVSLFLGSGFGAEWEDPPPGQPSQMQSNVDYDCKLTDPFFKSNERSYPDGTKSPSSRGDRPLKHTAKCFSTSTRGRAFGQILCGEAD